MRNFDKLVCEFTKNVNLIFGANGKGKTTILEAIHILSLSKSFRPGLKQNIIKHGENKFSLSSEIIHKEKNKTNISYSIYKDQRRIKINKKQINKLSDLVGIFPVVIMSPEDSDIISGPPQAGRNYINKLFSVVDKHYLLTLQNYKKALKQKREALFMNEDSHIEAWNHQMAVYGTKIWKKRKDFLQIFQEIFKKVWSELEPETTAEIKIKSPLILEEKAFLQNIKKTSQKEKDSKRALFGPHIDRLLFVYKNSSIKDFGSHGEKKIYLSALKLAEAQFIEKQTKKSPVVLMDDLFAKLDKKRSLATLKMASKNNQVFITTTDSQAGKLIASENKNIKYYHLDGKLKCYEA